MIIAEALREVFKGLQVTYVYDDQTITSNVEFHYGSQIELNNWVATMNQQGLNKYPLIWYVRDKYTEHNDYKDVFARLILFTSTEPFWLNYVRTTETYTKVLDPLANMVKERLDSHLHVSVYAKDITRRYDILDEPNYGVGLGDKQDFNTTQKKGEKGITIDPVDAKIMDFHMRINTKCIINK